MPEQDYKRLIQGIEQITKPPKDSSRRTVRERILNEDSLAERALALATDHLRPLFNAMREQQGIPVDGYKSLMGDILGKPIEIVAEQEHEVASMFIDFFSECLNPKNKREMIVYADPAQTRWNVNILSPREVSLLVGIYGLFGSPLTPDELNDIFGVTRTRIEQLKQNALHKLRAPKYITPLQRVVRQ